MDTRVAVISIIVEQEDAIEELNAMLHEARQYIVGRMASHIARRASASSVLPLMRRKIPSAHFPEKIGRLKGVSAKTAYSNVITPAEEGAEQ